MLHRNLITVPIATLPIALCLELWLAVLLYRRQAYKLAPVFFSYIVISVPVSLVPSFSTLVEHSNTLIEFYNTTEVLAKALSLGYGEEVHQKMLAVLGMLNLELGSNQ